MSKKPATTDATDQTEDTPPAAVEPPQSDEPADPTPPEQDDSPAVDVAALTAERDALAQQVTRLQVAAETGVPADLLTATAEDELRRQAEKLNEYAASRRPVDFGGGRRGEALSPRDEDPIRSALGR